MAGSKDVGSGWGDGPSGDVAGENADEEKEGAVSEDWGLEKGRDPSGKVAYEGKCSPNSSSKDGACGPGCLGNQAEDKTLRDHSGEDPKK